MKIKGVNHDFCTINKTYFVLFHHAILIVVNTSIYRSMQTNVFKCNKLIN